MLKKYAIAWNIITALLFLTVVSYNYFFYYDVSLSPGDSLLRIYVVYFLIFGLWILITAYILYKNRQESKKIDQEIKRKIRKRQI